MATFLALCAGLGLAAACGLRVFLPLFVAAIAVRAGFLDVGDHFEWMGSNASIVLFGTATVVEVAGFMIPWVDHVLDLVAAPLSAIAGAVLMTSQLLNMQVAGPTGAEGAAEPLLHPAVAWSLGIIVGATTASGVEAASIAGRLSSSVLTIGWLNPIYGMVETALSLFVTLLSLLGTFASVVGNEASIRIGRRRLITIAMLGSTLLASLIGYLGSGSYWIATGLLLAWGMVTWLDSSSLTAGAAGTADPARRGATLAVHSSLGYGGGFLGPLIVGLMLDAAGGMSPIGWTVAFGSIALLMVAALITFRVMRPRELEGDGSSTDVSR